MSATGSVDKELNELAKESVRRALLTVLEEVKKREVYITMTPLCVRLGAHWCLDQGNDTVKMTLIRPERLLEHSYGVRQWKIRRAAELADHLRSSRSGIR